MKRWFVIAALVAALVGFAPCAALAQNKTCPTMPAGDSTNACASTAFVGTAVGAAVTSFNGRTGAVVPQSGDYTFSQIGSPPTTLAGYGITNARTQANAPSFYVNGSGVSAACGPAGVSTCAIGVDSTACLTAAGVPGNTPATACASSQYVLNYLYASLDLKNTGANLYLAHGVNSAFSCFNGPFIGTAVVTINGDSAALTAVKIQASAGPGGTAVSVKDGCTLNFSYIHFIDNGTTNAGSFINTGIGQYGHVDLASDTFDTINSSGAALVVDYSSSVSFTDSGSSIIGSEGVPFIVRNGGTLDFSGQTVAVSNSLTWAIAFIVQSNGGIVLGVSSSTFGSPTGITGPRCIASGPPTFSGLNPNSIFPGNSNCVMTQIVGAVGVQSGTSVAYGGSGQCLTSGGSSSSLNTWANCSGTGVPQNNLNTQSGNYTIQTTDCGNTINETGVMKTITLPSVAGFATNCVLSIYNASSTRGQLLSGFPGALSAAPNNVLWMLDTVTVEIVNGVWSIQSYPVRHKLTASITVFVDNTNGNDANDCLAATTSACKTIQGALNYVGTWDGNTQAVTISVADGTYTNAVTVNGPFHGNPTVTVTGDVATPANALISVTSATAITLTNGATLSLGGFKITTTTSGGSILVQNSSFLTINAAMEYGAAAAGGGNHLTATNGGEITISASYTISGAGNFHFRAFAGGVISASSITITTSGTPAFATAFASAANGGQLTVFNQTYSGTGATGTRYSVSQGGVIFTNQTSGTYFPGNAAGTVASGGRIDGIGTPGVSSCGGSPGAASGTDFSGSVVEGSTATGCTITFTSASTMKACTVSLSTGAAVGVSTLGATLVVVHASLSGNTLYWTCAN